MKYHGVAYYPEAWPKERWDEDIRLMREANINMVRIGEFAWARFEPEEGRHELDWLTDICGRLNDAGIQILACTPSAAPPAWLSHRYPEMLAVQEDGTRWRHGGRRHYCPSSPAYREKSVGIARAIATALRDNPAVFAWQIDNELAPIDALGCVCDTCAARFREWLKAKYKTLDALNAAWGTVFWSGDFSDWEQLQPPYPRVSWKLDFARFESDILAEFAQVQAAALREVNSDWQITTNMWPGLTAAVDVGPMFENLDVAAYDGYIEYYASRDLYSATFDYYRNVKGTPKGFWIAETNAWNSNNTRAGSLQSLRPWAYMLWAKGCDMIDYFRWRQSIMGEEDHPAVTDWSGRPGRPYQHVKQICGEFEQLRERCGDLSLEKQDAAVLFDFASGHYGILENRETREHVVEANATLIRFNVMSDILAVRPDLNLEGYRLVVLPQIEIVDDQLREQLHRYVEAGGVLLGQPRLSTLDHNGKYLTEPMPGGLGQLFGVDVRERWKINNGRAATDAFTPEPAAVPATVDIELSLPNGQLNCTGWDHMEWLEVSPSTNVMGHYRSGDFLDVPMLVEKQHGQGRTLYQGCWLDAAGSRHLFAYALELAGIQPGPETPDQVDVLRRGTMRFYLNYGAQAVDVAAVKNGVTLIGDCDNGQVRLQPFGVCLVDES